MGCGCAWALGRTAGRPAHPGRPRLRCRWAARGAEGSRAAPLHPRPAGAPPPRWPQQAPRQTAPPQRERLCPPHGLARHRHPRHPPRRAAPGHPATTVTFRRRWQVLSLGRARIHPAGFLWSSPARLGSAAGAGSWRVCSGFRIRSKQRPRAASRSAAWPAWHAPGDERGGSGNSPAALCPDERAIAGILPVLPVLPVLKTGCRWRRWRDMPAASGPPAAVYSRCARCSSRGVWPRAPPGPPSERRPAPHPARAVVPRGRHRRAGGAGSWRSQDEPVPARFPPFPQPAIPATGSHHHPMGSNG
jgi:hypothetical protein